MHYRPFLNCDPPALAEIWARQPAGRARLQPMRAGILDDLVLAKPFFDARGLLVAVGESGPVGFAHAGFGPNESGSSLDHRIGSICQLVVHPALQASEVAGGLARECERYLLAAGAEQIVGGAVGHLAPFYLGLYGGCQLPGVLESDAAQRQAFAAAGYQPHPECTVLACDLAGFRPPADRQLMALRRRCKVKQVDPVDRSTWWHACHWGQTEIVQFELSHPQLPPSQAQFWDIEPLASSWGRHAMGLIQLELPDSSDQPLLATHLLAESLREFAARGVSLVEAQVRETDSALRESCQRLGFQQVDRGLRYQRSD